MGIVWKTFDGSRVSRAWWELLSAARADGVKFHLNSGKRTMAEQAALFRQNMVRPGVPRPGRPLTAVPSPFAPHIRSGRRDHALDVQDENLFGPGGGAERLMAWAAKHGVPLHRTVPSEAWHLEAVSGWRLQSFARKRRAKRREAARLERKQREPVKDLNVSGTGVRLVASFEGFRGYAYNDPAGHATVGYGRLLHLGPVTKADARRWGTKENPLVTKAEARGMLREDLRAHAVDPIRFLVKVPLRQSEFDALASLVFNIGPGNLRNSTVLRELNKGHYKRAGAAFLLWTKAGSPLKALPGLVRRRAAEVRLWRKRP